MEADLSAGGPRLLILGDSWIRGLGTSKRTFGRMIAKSVHASEVLDLSAISRTAPDIAADHLDEIAEFAPQVALVCVGGADSLIFPAWTVQRLIDRYAPKEWQGVEGMMPLARYSRDRWPRIRQRVEQTVKVLMKQFLINVFGGRRRVTIAQLDVAVHQILAVLDRSECDVVCIGFPRVDGWLSPKANASVAKTNVLLRAIMHAHPRATYIPTDSIVTRWDDYLPDHVHLNLRGHRNITDGVVAKLRETGFRWTDIPAGVAAMNGETTPARSDEGDR